MRRAPAVWAAGAAGRTRVTPWGPGPPDSSQELLRLLGNTGQVPLYVCLVYYTYSLDRFICKQQ